MAGNLIAKRYEVISELGRGGMGVVYLAFDQLLQMQVALKEISFASLSGIAKKEVEQSFLTEAQICATLSHPNLAKYLNFFQEGGKYYLVIKFVSGTSLKDVIASGTRYGESAAIALTMQVAGALGYAHSQGIVHRDIKPDNIMIDSDHMPIVIDFGIAKTGGTSSNTMYVAASAVSPYFGAPEQMAGKGTDPTSDIYSLGAVLYETITGNIQQVFPHNPAERLVLPSITVFAGVSVALATVIAKATAVRPPERFQTMGEFVQALAALSGQPSLGSSSVGGQANATTTITVVHKNNDIRLNKPT